MVSCAAEPRWVGVVVCSVRLALTAHAILVSIESMRVCPHDLKPPERHVPAVQVRRGGAECRRRGTPEVVAQAPVERALMAEFVAAHPLPPMEEG